MRNSSSKVFGRVLLKPDTPKFTRGIKIRIATNIIRKVILLEEASQTVKSSFCNFTPLLWTYTATKEKFPSIKGFSADAGYQGTTVDHVEKNMKLKIEISKKLKDEWAVLPKRWVVEITFSWINNTRRLAKDFEILTCSAENFIRISMIRLMLRRIV